MKYLSFGLTALITVALATATFLEKYLGTAFVLDKLYTSPAAIALWAVAVACAAAYIWKSRKRQGAATLLIHASFAIILAGALVTHLCGLQGSIHLREGSPASSLYQLPDGSVGHFPFKVRLKEFHLDYYPATHTPMDFVSTIAVEDGDGTTREGEVSMNNIFSHRHYRFYQSRYDTDGAGTTLSISYDPFGIGITYAGYALLLLGMCAFFWQRKSRFRALLRHPLLKGGLAVGLLLAPCAPAQAATKVLPRETADRFGNLFIHYNGRICPLETFARDFTKKLCGKDSYRGLTATQVLTGWFFYYDDWKSEPMITIKEKAARSALGISGKQAALTDFTGARGYKLDALLGSADGQKAMAANEQFTVASTVATGSALQIYPARTGGDEAPLQWFSPADRLPQEMPEDQWIFIRKSMNLVAEMVYSGEYAEADTVLEKIRKYQLKTAGADNLPSAQRFKAEMLYNRLNHTRPLAFALIAAGLLLFGLLCRRILHAGRETVVQKAAGSIVAAAAFLFLALLVGLRGYVSGHVPLANGFETMQFMALCSLGLALGFKGRFSPALPFGLLVCGLSLLVGTMGESNPQITSLMPVLSSPLLSLHVVVIMLSYSLLAFVMLNGLTAILLHRFGRQPGEQIERLHIISRLMLTPALFLLACGIFIGAVWANVSWGRYWGWDPKEVWALVTMLVYAAPLHDGSLARFRRPLFFHRFCFWAFLCVLVTYFGVNFFLGGLHSYA